MTLGGLANPSTLIVERLFWGLSEWKVSEIFNRTIELIYNRWGHLVKQLQDQAILPKMEMFCQAVHDRGSPLDRCWGFMDKATREIDRPPRQQRLWYKAWERKQELKHQSVDSPDGIIRMLWGPMLGRRRELPVLDTRGLLRNLKYCHDDDGTAWHVYGEDPAFQAMLSPWMQVPFKGDLTAAQRKFNDDMNSVQVEVEGGFEKIVDLWPRVDYVMEQREVMVSTAGLDKQYAVAGVLTNCHSCFYGNSTSEYFGIRPPRLRSYLRGEG